MKNVLIVLGVIVAAAAIGAIWVISVKNGLIAADEEVNGHWSQIDTQLQRRVDLIPNLVATVKGYAKHEEKIFTGIADARSKLLAAKGPEEKAAASAEVTGALGRLLAIAENYPALRANENFVRLQDELAGTENRIAVARGRYNNAVKEYNRKIRQLEIEKVALSKEKDESSLKRLEALQQELAAEQANFNELKARWEEEKSEIGEAKNLKKDLEKAKFDLSVRFSEGDYKKASELQYKVIPELESRLHAIALSEKKEKLVNEVVDEEENNEEKIA